MVAMVDAFDRGHRGDGVPCRWSASGTIWSREEKEMNWDRIEGNWKQLKGNVIDQWDDLTDDQPGSRIRETYGSMDDAAEAELTDWQQRLSEIERDRDDAARQ
jgi:uncharacterized protein YjbJ (UPF0337 family)